MQTNKGIMRNAVKKMGSCYISFAHKYLCILLFNSLLQRGRGRLTLYFMQSYLEEQMRMEASLVAKPE